MSLKLAVYCLFVLVNVNSEPIIIKTGIAKDHSQHQDGGVYDVSSKKGISSYEADQGYNKDKEGKHVSAKDAGQYVQELADNKHHLNQNEYSNESVQKQGGGSIENVGKQAGHKKGHHKSGFKNSYHKEESGSKSSYYDDNDDQGGEYFLNSKQGVYSDDSNSKSRGSQSDGSKYIKDDSRRGAYNNEGLYNKDFGANKNYDQKKYNDNRAVQGQSNGGNRFGESGRYTEEKYYTPPHYVNDDYYYPEEDHYYADYSSPKRTITVYEDPRVYESGSYEDYPEYNSRYDDPVHVLVRKPIPVERNYYHEDDVYKHGYY